MSTTNPATDDIAMGQRIRLTRMSKGMSQSALAEACGITFQQIQKYEKGTNRVGFSRLVQIAKALGVSTTALVDDPADADTDRTVRRLLAERATASDVGAVDLYLDLPANERKAVQTLISALHGAHHAASREVAA